MPQETPPKSICPRCASGRSGWSATRSSSGASAFGVVTEVARKLGIDVESLGNCLIGGHAPRPRSDCGQRVPLQTGWPRRRSTEAPGSAPRPRSAGGSGSSSGRTGSCPEPTRSSWRPPLFLLRIPFRYRTCDYSVHSKALGRRIRRESTSTG
jgi:hypothetical protein